MQIYGTLGPPPACSLQVWSVLSSVLRSVRLSTMAEAAVKDWKSKFLAVKGGLQHIAGLERSYPRLRPFQVNREEGRTIPHTGTLLEQAEVRKSSDRYSPSSVQDLLVADSTGFVPRNIVLFGPHGIGKTTTLQKIMLDWVSGVLYKDKFNFVFYMSSKDLNQIDGSINITKLVSKTCKLDCPEDVMKSIFEDPTKILVLIDGFDELHWTLEDDYDDYEDPFLETHKDTFLRCWFNKDVLGETPLIISSSSLSLKKLKDVVNDPCSIELLGLSENEIEKSLHQSFPEKDQADQALSVLKENGVLWSFCAVPLTCQLVCTVLKAGMKEDLASANCKTLTSVYLLYLQSLLKGHASGKPVEACLKKLSALANEGVLNHKTLFEEEDLTRHGLSITDVASVFPNATLFQQDVEAPSKYSFIHLSLQEFFAALYYVLGQEAEDKETSGVKGDSFLPRVCKEKSINYLAENHPFLVAPVRFLFGLLHNGQLKELASSIGCNASLKAKAAVENWLTGGKCSRIPIAALSCLYEAQDDGLCRRLLNTENPVVELGFYSGAMENICTRELLYCFKDGKNSMSLEDFLMRPNDLQLLSTLFHGAPKLSFTRCGFAEDLDMPGKSSWLSNTNSKVKELEFHVCVVTPAFFNDLASLLSTSRSLTILHLSHHNLEVSAVKALCDGLRHQDCILQELILNDCNLTPSCCEELGSALKINRSLLKLDTALNNPGEAGVRFLCEGLKEPGCTLQDLRLDFSDLTSSCCEHIGALLKTNRSITVLHMKDNDIKDAGAKLLCEGLLNPGCPLKELRLHESNITSDSCEDLKSVLLKNHTLTVLDLTDNNLQDSGMKILCEALRDPTCTLQELNLQHTDLSPDACQDIGSVITVNRSLHHLDLTWNSIKDSGVKVLCEALKNPNCTLKELRLYGCDLTVCEDLASVIHTNHTLTKLELSGNQFDDQATKALCEAMRSPGCSMQEFRVGYCAMTATCAEEVLSTINTNKTLEVLDVSFGYEGEPPADIDDLCKKFHHPAATVEKNETEDGTYIYFKYNKQK
ncbi:NACHT, LRR and PYD domains-containing protein 14-like isoform X1 [Hyperolius riggenbachi]|uniref:NACHT, LRR and PYD domains-containing protein 14-like isoform X1 n=1 Tax=Hyperolius riggenbachi TaxID=752182 RepID=UPI0035A2C3EA